MKDKIIDENYDFYYGESLFNMYFLRNDKVVGSIQYGVYEGKPNVKMIEVLPEFQRQGIATMLLQELQRKYDGIPIHFGFTTKDGTKLLNKVTKLVKNPKYNKKIGEEIKLLNEKSDKLYMELKSIQEEMLSLYYKQKEGVISNIELERYHYVCKREMDLDFELNHLGNKVYELDNPLDDEEKIEYYQFVILPTMELSKNKDEEINTVHDSLVAVMKDAKARTKEYKTVQGNSISKNGIER